MQEWLLLSHQGHQLHPNSTEISKPTVLLGLEWLNAYYINKDQFQCQVTNYWPQLEPHQITCQNQQTPHHSQLYSHHSNSTMKVFLWSIDGDKPRGVQVRSTASGQENVTQELSRWQMQVTISCSWWFLVGKSIPSCTININNNHVNTPATIKKLAISMAINNWWWIMSNGEGWGEKQKMSTSEGHCRNRHAATRSWFGVTGYYGKTMMWCTNLNREATQHPKWNINYSQWKSALSPKVQARCQIFAWGLWNGVISNMKKIWSFWKVICD